MLRILQTDRHPARSVDPFRLLPCACATIEVHITNGTSMGDDLVECSEHGWVLPMFELYRGMTPRGEST